MYFDRAPQHDGVRVGVIRVSPKKHILPYSFVLIQLCSNNMVEYQALILGLQMAIEMGTEELNAYDDS